MHYLLQDLSISRRFLVILSWKKLVGKHTLERSCSILLFWILEMRQFRSCVLVPDLILHLSILLCLYSLPRHRCAQWPVMLRNSLNDLVFEHRSACCATEPGYAGDIGAIETWLIDYLSFQEFQSQCWLTTRWTGCQEHCILWSRSEGETDFEIRDNVVLVGWKGSEMKCCNILAKVLYFQSLA